MNNTHSVRPTTKSHAGSRLDGVEMALVWGGACSAVGLAAAPWLAVDWTLGAAAGAVSGLMLWLVFGRHS